MTDPTATQPWFNVALVGGLVGAIIGGLINVVLTVYKAAEDKRIAKRQVQRDYHLARRDALAAVAAHLHEVKQHIYDCRKLFYVCELERRGTGNPRSLHGTLKPYFDHSLKINETYVKIMESAERYGQIPNRMIRADGEEVKLYFRSLVSYLPVILLRAPMAASNPLVIKSDLEANEVLAHIHHMIRDVHTLLRLEQELALLATEGRLPAKEMELERCLAISLPYMASIERYVSSSQPIPRDDLNYDLLDLTRYDVAPPTIR